ncbi:MAG: hypothetical protein HY716_08135 [Planctomycetes bacterium]|nr:hypothetical protein [Planctomycetota bacterium]
MNVTSYCRRCLKGRRFDPAAPPERFECPNCGDARSLVPSDAVRRENRLDLCPVCGSGYFYREKDFNSWVGGAVIVAAIVGFLLLADRNILAALGILLGAALLDFLVYWIVPFRYVCYRCLATIRGAAPNASIGPYDLGVAGRFADDYEEQRRDSGGRR